MAKITIYSTPSCMYCKMAKEFFTKNNIAYSEHDIAVDDAARDEMLAKSGQMGVPVIDIDGKIVVGFDRGAIEAALGMK